MLEVVVETVEDALSAEKGGAGQVEVKCDYLEYGLTPTFGMLEQICSQVRCDVLCMIRPHARTFVYTSADLAAMASDMRNACQLPISGFLVGCLTAEGEIDTEAIRYLQDAAGNPDLHFHLAWEQTPDPFASLERLIESGVKSVRTSGAGIRGQAGENLDQLRTYHKEVADRIELFLAGGITIENVAQLVADTGIPNVHTGSGVREPQMRTGVVSEQKTREMQQELQRVLEV